MAEEDLTPSCRLCGTAGSTLFHTDKHRSYFVCTSGCGAAFVPDAYLVSEAEEKSEYDLHENQLNEPGYRTFLSRAAVPLGEYLSLHPAPKGEVPYGMDFGCGPAPALATMLREPPYNYRVVIFDKYYFPETEHLLDDRDAFDFIVSTEVAEHLKEPLVVFRRLWRAIRPGGVLVIMTKRFAGTIERFRNWHYIRDRTHICFYHVRSFQWIADTLTADAQHQDCVPTKCSVSYPPGSDVVLLVKDIVQ